MTNEKFLRAVEIKNELDYLKNGFGFSEINNYKEIAETIEEISVYSGKGHFKLYKERDAKLFEFVKLYLGLMEDKKQEKIKELEKQFEEL